MYMYMDMGHGWSDRMFVIIVGGITTVEQLLAKGNIAHFFSLPGVGTQSLLLHSSDYMHMYRHTCQHSLDAQPRRILCQIKGYYPY